MENYVRSLKGANETNDIFRVLRALIDMMSCLEKMITTIHENQKIDTEGLESIDELSNFIDCEQLPPFSRIPNKINNGKTFAVSFFLVIDYCNKSF